MSEARCAPRTRHWQHEGSFRGERTHLMTVFGKWLMATSVRRGKVASSLPSHARDWDGPLRGERVRPSTCVDKYTSMSLS